MNIQNPNRGAKTLWWSSFTNLGTAAGRNHTECTGGCGTWRTSLPPPPWCRPSRVGSVDHRRRVSTHRLSSRPFAPTSCEESARRRREGCRARHGGNACGRALRWQSLRVSTHGGSARRRSECQGYDEGRRTSRRRRRCHPEKGGSPRRGTVMERPAGPASVVIRKERLQSSTCARA